jgi:hypothetical protein
MMIKQFQDLFNQIESKHVEFQTFEKIRERELESVDKRVNALNQDVQQQSEREKQLQAKFRQLCLERDELRATV